ncbi:hypothetical protein [Bartonella sp. CB189]|uniref:hypothetical protein n=1 Tax=Bartonella sp. CB189 TaxID=3112254 RepID=UPI002F96CE97
MNMFIAPLLTHFIGEEFKSTIKQVRFQAFSFLLIGISLLISLIFLCVMGFIALCLVMHPLAAASTMFFIWLFLAIFGVFVSRIFTIYQRNYKKKKLEEQRHKLVTDVTLSGIGLLMKQQHCLKLSAPILGLATYFLWKKEKK